MILSGPWWETPHTSPGKKKEKKKSKTKEIASEQQTEAGREIDGERERGRRSAGGDGEIKALNVVAGVVLGCF